MSQRQALDNQVKNSTEKALKFEDLVMDIVTKLVDERDSLKKSAEENEAKISEMERQSMATQLDITQKTQTIKVLEQRLRISQSENCQTKMMAEFSFGLASKLSDAKDWSSSIGTPSITGTPVASNPISMETLPADESAHDDAMHVDGDGPKNMDIGSEVVVLDDGDSDDENANKSNDSLELVDPLVFDKLKNSS